MSSATEATPPRVIGSRLGLREQVVQIWAYRSLLRRMIQKELKVKYKNSFLGFFWSMLNPALYLVVFWVVFQIILKAGIPSFPIFLLSGLLVWNFFSTALGAATTSITSNAALVGKVYFPREVLPLASVGASLVHFFLQAIVLLGALLVMRHDVAISHLPAIPFALAVAVILAAGFGLFLAAANVYLRDTQHLVELALLAWFWVTPIVYAPQLIADRLAGKSWSWVEWLNPMASVVVTFQRAIYAVLASDGGTPTGRPFDTSATRILPADMDAGWYVTHLGGVALAGLVVLLAGLVFFGRVSGNFAEEI